MNAIQHLNSLKDPEATLLEVMSTPGGWHQFSYDFCAYYLPDSPVQRLHLVAINHQSRSYLALAEWGRLSLPPELDSAGLLEQLGSAEVALFELGKPWMLAPVSIPKPWGRELWYTGIEARGQSRLVAGNGQSVPIPWMLALLPHSLLGRAQKPLTLLKILDPLPEPVFGDLYFEMHEQKQEVYVVTHIDSTAWPEGKGGIRFGFNQHKRSRAASDQAFVQAYGQAVADYRSIRSEIDQQIDRMRVRDGFGINEPVAAVQQKQWLAQLPEALLTREQEARAHMDGFTHVKPLSVGDVVKVPCFTPHSLMHGVTTVEFQTPVYERKILSFAQKVLTQSHWDTDEALAKVRLQAPEDMPLKVLAQGPCLLREQVVEFDDFCVDRITLEEGGHWSCTSDDYGLLMVVTGEAMLNGHRVQAGEACFVPAQPAVKNLHNSAQSTLVALWSVPC